MPYYWLVGVIGDAVLPRFVVAHYWLAAPPRAFQLLQFVNEEHKPGVPRRHGCRVPAPARYLAAQLAPAVTAASSADANRHGNRLS